LVERVRRVIAIESDARLAAHLRGSLPDAEIVHADALKIEWPAFDVMVSNLPYQISSPLTFRLLATPFDHAVLMYQWEFARRMVAAPGTADYSRLSVGVYVRASCEILERVPRNAFRPQPKVNSALVRLEPRPSPFPIADPDRFDAVVAALFEHRRKTVENGLRLAWRALAASPAALEALLPAVPFRAQRVEELRPEEIEQVAAATRGAKG
jgi:16S rRNA (adenine1518-N6/adenine1519-N6)-dimethyltransferase